MEQNITPQDPKPKWQKTTAANIVRYNGTRMLYVRAKVRGKLINRSLKTSRLTVAQLRLNKLLKEEREKASSRDAVSQGKMLFADALEVFRNRLTADPATKPRTKEYREERIGALLKSWADIIHADIRNISKTKCLEWAARFNKGASPIAYNNTVGTLRMILEIGVEAGAISINPAKFIKKAKVIPKPPQLPTNEQFMRIVQEIEHVNRRFSQPCADLVRFLAFGGFRKSEAARIIWSDCDFSKGQILVKGDPHTGTKNWAFRRVPMIPEMRTLLIRLREERAHEGNSAPVMVVRECLGALTAACKKVGATRITHHDLRHLFATRCIESGVDIPTVSRWLGHKDGGALAMKTYGHLRDHHSVTMAQKVVFQPESNPQAEPK